MAEFSNDDAQWMQQALDLAVRGQGHVEPNPMVGCTLVKDQRLLGKGFHQRFGGPHAEREALKDAREQGVLVDGATAYVSLEPCCHFGKTPPCIEALIEAKVKRVVVASVDPNPLVAGQGIEALKVAGIEVDVGLLEPQARQLNAPFFKRCQHQQPWVIAKWAMSLDGKIATRTGDSQWISGEASRRWVHQLRGRVDAIMVGIGTALADDPMLTARPAGIRQARRIVVDSTLRLPLTSRLVATAAENPPLILAGPLADPNRLHELESRGCQVLLSQCSTHAERLQEYLFRLSQEFEVTNLLVEGGASLLGGLADIQQIDQCEVFVAPRLIGGQESPSPMAGIGLAKLRDTLPMVVQQVQQHESDLHITARRDAL